MAKKNTWPKHVNNWLPALCRQGLRLKAPIPERTHVYVCLADHYEPMWKNAAIDVQLRRVQAWSETYPCCAARHRDAAGRHPQHTFFFPAEEYRPEVLEPLARLCRQGWGDVEVHLHHDLDTPQGLAETLTAFTQALHDRHGLLQGREPSARYAFIHGNWALNNSRPDGRWCGVDDETSVLLATGCYADLTMPSGPDAAQVCTVNSIYYAIPRPTPRGHENGPAARAGTPPAPGLLMIQGPLALNWASRKWGILPKLETADVAWHTPPTAERVKLWVDRHIHVQGAPGHIVVKLSTHGAQDRNIEFLLGGGGLERLWTLIEQYCQERGYVLHYVTAYDLFRMVRGLEIPATASAAGQLQIT